MCGGLIQYSDAPVNYQFFPTGEHDAEPQHVIPSIKLWKVHIHATELRTQAGRHDLGPG